MIYHAITEKAVKMPEICLDCLIIHDDAINNIKLLAEKITNKI